MRRTLAAAGGLLVAAAVAAPVPRTELATPADEFAGRLPAERARLLKAGGGGADTEAAVDRGLKWLARQQRANGSWTFDGRATDQTAAATGLALLPFLGAGHSHKTDGPYRPTVTAGLKFLLADQQPDGGFRSGKMMYAHALAALAVVEAYGMTRDKAIREQAQKAVTHVVEAQGPDGSWGYTPGTRGDTSIAGWQVQVLAAAAAAGLDVPAATLRAASGYLDRAADPTGGRYAYTPTGRPTPALTGAGLLARFTTDGWKPGRPAVVAGVGFVADAGLPSTRPLETYGLYYNTRLLHAAGGKEWGRWNPDVQSLLLKLQRGEDAKGAAGSWDADAGQIGGSCGRLGTTALAALTLEVYYRYPAPAAGPADKK